MTTTISNSILSATINHKGGELVSLRRKPEKKEFIWEASPYFWGKHAPILFPIVGTLKNNTYQYLGKTYIMNRHGFARDFEFELIAEEQDKVAFSLQSNEATMAAYPFHFELQLIYTLKENELSVTFKVFNKSLETMPFSIGGHPAFALQNQFDHYTLEFDTNESLRCYQLENGLLSAHTNEIQLQNGRLPLAYSLFENDALVFKAMPSKQIWLLENGRRVLRFSFADFPNFGIWTKVGAPFLCLEPWLGYADTTIASGNIFEKEGIQLLESYSYKTYQFSIEII